MFENFFRAVFGSRGAIVLHTPSLVIQPGATIPVHIRFEALEQAREVAFLRLHLQMTVHQWVQGATGPTIQPQATDVIPPIMVSEKFAVVPGGVQDFQLQITVPQGVYPTMPGQIEYALWAVAPVVGQTIDSAQRLPLTIVGTAMATPFVPGAAPMQPVAPAPMGAQFPLPPMAPTGPVAMGAQPPSVAVAQPEPAQSPSVAVAQPSAPTAPSYSVGDDVEAQGPDGQWSSAMVVESRGPILLVQWKDGRVATWVRAEQARKPGQGV